MLFNKLTLISIAAIIAIASILVFIIPTDSIETQSLINNETQSLINNETQSLINNETQSVINSEKSSINHTLSIDQSISVSEANNRVAINLFKLLENDTQKNIFFSPFSILTAMTIGYEGARGNTALEMEKALGISFDDEHGHKIAKYCSHCLCVCIRCNSNTLDKRALLNLYNTLDLY